MDNNKGPILINITKKNKKNKLSNNLEIKNIINEFPKK